MSIVFFGTPEFAVPSLNALIASGEVIALVVTQTDKIKGRVRRPSPPPVKIFSLEAGLKVLQPATLRDKEVTDKISMLEPEFIVVVAFGKILPKSILGIPRHGCVNVHASLLPRYRGASPVQWAILKGETKSGVTTMLMDEGLDTGPVLLRQETEILADDTGDSLGKRLAALGASLLVRTVQGLREGGIMPVPQSGTPSYAPPLKKTDGLIDWSEGARQLVDFVRGMQPWPGAYCRIGNEKITILSTSAIEGTGTPGIIEKTGIKDLLIGTGDGLLSIKELQPAGKRRMSVEDFLQGRSLRKGMRVL